MSNRTETIIPLDMLLNLPEKGCYAVRPDSNHPYTFFRITRPKSGIYKDVLKVQTQHGERYEVVMTLTLGTSRHLLWYNKAIEQDLLLVVVDPKGSGIAYGRELGHCMVCSKELTDERSRYYGIGPDCETRYPEIIDIVNDTEGVFKFGGAA